ncbi:MarR family transcriptional regulator [Qipengyuania sp. GH25]|uniref:MarR family transcriptional regulator n=1 Tax=Qipengyuania pacifica TaxID=2860199 RepID=A0ABS7JK71_9SPHN|nr:MarR family transcriptional regulator [Qipengyuania aerophila]MBX7489800.1 MarR family transcriptional regulator [Qipengyuania aerophila]
MSKTAESHPPAELTKVRDFLCFSVYSATNAFNRMYKSVLDQFGLTYTQYLVLTVLAERGEASVGELGEMLYLESNTLTPLLKRLETSDLVGRRRDPADERIVRVALTKSGRKLAEQAQCVPSEVLKAANISEEQIARLNAELNLLRRNLRASQTNDAS